MKKRMNQALLGMFLVCLVLIWIALREKYSVVDVPKGTSLIGTFESKGFPEIKALKISLNNLATEMSSVFESKSPILIVNFWASWCEPCVKEFPSMVKLSQEFPGQVQIVAVSMDESKDDVKPFLKLFGVPREGFEVLWSGANQAEINRQMALTKLPESFILGPDRKLIRKVIGAEDWSGPGAIQYFKELLAQLKK